MALGIDAGMVASEAADMVTHSQPTMRARIKWWVRAYMVLSILASMLLNCMGVWMHAPEQHRILATMFAGMIPIMIFIMFRIMGALVQD
jgi:hypothetical protein